MPLPATRRLVLAATATATATLIGAPAPALAAGAPRVTGQARPFAFPARLVAPVCGSPVAAAPVPTAAPWTDQRYPADRLTPLASGAGVTVAVIDSGVDDRHPQLTGRVIGGNDYLDPGEDGRRDCAGHGTAVASIIAAIPRAGAPLRGLAPGSRILPVRVSEQQVIDGKETGRTVTAAQFARSIRWAVDHGAKVVNLSVVLYEDNPAVRAAIAYGVAHNAVLVAAVGNLHDSGDPRPYPAAYPGVLGVGAIGPDGTRAPFSQIGDYVDLVAPGAEVLTATAGRGVAKQDGTSYAAPFVSATAALIRQYRPDLTAAQVAERIVATADPAPEGNPSDAYGSGVLDPYRAVTETVPAGRPEPAAVALRPERTDPSVTAQEARREGARGQAFMVGGFASGAAVVVVLLAAVLLRGARRRWRPGGVAPR